MRNIHAVHGIFGDAKLRVCKEENGATRETPAAAKLAAANKKTGLEKIPIRFWG
jgi:hypothetical protein